MLVSIRFKFFKRFGQKGGNVGFGQIKGVGGFSQVMLYGQNVLFAPSHYQLLSYYRETGETHLTFQFVMRVMLRWDITVTLDPIMMRKNVETIAQNLL